ncbi:MAG: isopentenyl transferase family protein, partial [Clostridia bacterium]|nr:isopentenyl transferase family protein [Clostridia bacterium]
MKIPLIVVAGPTASGKTAMAIHLAQKFCGEIVSADSMQIYKKLNTGTAKPTKEELLMAPHHMIDILDINESFSVVDYCT